MTEMMFSTDEIKPLRYATREEWLVAAIDAMRPWFEAIEVALPRQIRVSVGFSVGSAAENKFTRGVTWSTAASTDATNHVFISPELDDAFKVLRTLLHELVHVSDDCASGHGGTFKTRAEGLGLVGKMTSSEAGPILTAELLLLWEVLGEYPHAAMNIVIERGRTKVPAGVAGGAAAPRITSGAPTQTARNIKITCTNPECGNNARTTRKWIDLGLTPICPCNGQPMAEG